MNKLKAPFPYFGGKSMVAHEVWYRLGNSHNYIEPFCGSAAVLLARPEAGRVETVNDINCFISNFYRAVRNAPDEVAKWADCPINEADLHAVHRWLMLREDVLEWRRRMHTDIDYFDAKVAGRWVWGACSWIAAGWCAGRHLDDGEGGPSNMRANVQNVKGVNAVKRPKLSRSDCGVQSLSVVGGTSSWDGTRPHLSTEQGIFKPGATTTEDRRPDLTNPHGIHIAGYNEVESTKRPIMVAAGGKGVFQGQDNCRPHLGRAYGLQTSSGITEWMYALAERLRRVRVCCGDWMRVCTPAVTEYIGDTSMFFDPPYSKEAGRDPNLYAYDDLDVAHKVREFCIAHGDNPRYKIALCGYDTEHAMPEGWTAFAWKTQGGYGHMHKENNVAANRLRETIWFSPHCQQPRQGGLF